MVKAHGSCKISPQPPNSFPSRFTPRNAHLRYLEYPEIQTKWHDPFASNFFMFWRRDRTPVLDGLIESPRPCPAPVEHVGSPPARGGGVVTASPDVVVVVVAYETSASCPPPSPPSPLDVHMIPVATLPRGDVDRSSPPPPRPLCPPPSTS
jgi:hypothetical protein